MVFEEEFETTADGFRKVMRWLRHRNSGKWTSSDGTRLQLRELKFHPPIRGVPVLEDGVLVFKREVGPILIQDKARADPHRAQFWAEVVSPGEAFSTPRCAAIDVREIRGRVLVEFADAEDPRAGVESHESVQPVGRAVRDLRDCILQLLQEPPLPLGFSERVDPLDLMRFRQQQTIIHVEALNCTTEDIEGVWRRLGNAGRTPLRTPDGMWLRLGPGRPLRAGWEAPRMLYPVEPAHQGETSDHRTRPRWVPHQERPQTCGCIEVDSAATGVVVFFHDRFDALALSPKEVEPLGRAFEYVCRRFVDEVKSLPEYTTDVLDIPPDSEPPKRRRKRDDWREVYSLWNQMKRVYKIEYDDPYGDPSPPSYQKLQFRARTTLNIDYSIRNIRKVINCGNAGLLEEENALRYWKEKEKTED